MNHFPILKANALASLSSLCIRNSDQVSPLSILKVIQALPDIPKEDVDELTQLIEQGKLPVRMQGEFNSEGARVRRGKTFQDL